MKPAPRFSMPMISPTPQFNFVQNTTQTTDDAQNNTGQEHQQQQQVLPRAFDAAQAPAVTTRRASHFLIPPIDPKFDFPMKPLDPPIKFKQIEKLGQQKEMRNSSVTDNLDEFLNKFQ